MGHYFDRSPPARSEPGSVELVLPDWQATLATDRGVFSPGGIDAGTKLLLLEAPPPDTAEAGHLLDLGCGYGPIALTLARRAPKATVWAVDVNERARELTATNAAALGLDGVRAVAPEDVPSDVRFAGQWSNPPIRVGKAALHDMLLAWLPRLDDGAAAWLVVQKHLGSDSLARWLADQGYSVDRLTSRVGYRVLEVRPMTWPTGRAPS